MSNANQQKQLAQTIELYLSKTDKITREEVLDIIRTAEQYAKVSEHKKFINIAFNALKKTLNKHTFTNTSKRFLVLFDELLQLSIRKQQFSLYSQTISNMLIECYIYVFSLIFQYQVLEATLDWKVYRMLWAKNINNQTFDALRTEISAKYRNFDLNKGFTTESTDKIKKRYAKKGFTEAEVKRYMQANKQDQKNSYDNNKQPQNRVKQNSEDMSKERLHPSPRKIKRHLSPQNKAKNNIASINVAKDISESRSSSSIEPNYNQTHNDQPAFRQHLMTPSFQNFPYEQQLYNENRAIPISYQKEVVAPMSGDYPRPEILCYSQPKPYFSPTMSNVMPSLQPYSSPQRSNVEPFSKLRSKSQKTSVPEKSSQNSYKIILKSLYQKLFNCKQCGLLFQSKINLTAHREDHVLSAQNQILSKQYNKASENPTALTVIQAKSSHLLSIENWVSRHKEEQQPVQQQIAIQKDINIFSFFCYFCQEQLNVTWCQPLEDWTLKDSVKVKEENGSIAVAHLNCYKYFVEKSNQVQNDINNS